jgi:catechol 2,3-dioxygenase-like lactoylglutathione lyase family enzyme
MAYRFLVEVPESLDAEAAVVISDVDDAQVVVVRASHGRGADERYMDLTVAAHSLRVIDALYRWYSNLGGAKPDIRLVLHSGERQPLGAHAAGDMVAAIRRDQPWVERTIPKIGEHVAESFSAPANSHIQEQPVTAILGTQTDSTSTNRTWSHVQAVQESTAARAVTIRELNHIAVRVTDIDLAERFYSSFFSMDVVGRGRRNADGEMIALSSSYSWREVLQTGQEADVTFMRNGPLVISLERLGRGARLERGLLDHISIRVDATTFTSLKGQVLMRSMELIESAETAFAFRDPLGVTWEIALQSVPEFI